MQPELPESSANEAGSPGAEHRIRFLLESSSMLSAAMEYDATLTAVGHLCVTRIADWAIVYGLTNDGHPRCLNIAHRDPSKQALARELRDLPIVARRAHPALDVIRTRRSRFVAEMPEMMMAEMFNGGRALEISQTLGASSLMLVPMTAGGRALGAIALISAAPDRRFETTDLALAEDVALRGALALDNALLHGEVKRANQTKADFLAIVSHDLRTPLTAIIGYSDLLQMGVPERLSDRSKEHVERIRASAKHLLDRLNEVLTRARADGAPPGAARPPATPH